VLDTTPIYQLPLPNAQNYLTANLSALAWRLEQVLGSNTWKLPVSTAAALPLVGNAIGDVRLALDTLTMYAWDGLAWNVVGGGGAWTHYIWLPNTSTTAQIQAALNDVGIECVFLESGTYAITASLTIPEGKTLSADVLQPDPGVTPRAVLNLTSGFQVIINKGVLQHIQVTVASGSLVNATLCTMARVMFCDFRTTAGTTVKYALSGTFAHVQFINVANMSGVEWTGASTVLGFYNVIENVSVNGGALINTYGFNTVAATFLIVRDCYFNGCYYGVAISNGSNLVVEDIKVNASSRYGFQIASVTGSKFACLCVENGTGVSAFDITTVTGTDFRGITAKNCTGMTARVVNLVTVNDSYVIDVSINSCTAATHYFYATTCSNTRFNRISAIGCTGSASGQAALYFLSCTACEFRFLLVQTWTTTLANTRGVYLASNAGCIASDVQAISVGTNAALTCYPLYASSNTNTIFKDFLAVSCISSNYVFWGAGQTHCELSGLAVRSSTAALGAIFFNNWNQCTISRVSSHQNTTAEGIFFANATETCFDYLDSYANTGNGIHIIGPNVINSSFNHIQTAKNGGIGLRVENTTGSLVSDVLSQGNTGVGIASSGNVQCKFSSIIARANVAGNLTAGTTDSYCTWDNVHLSNPGAGTRNFTATAATATCYYNGGFEQLGGGLANDNFPQVNWITSSVVAIP
jgi:hypothetical protein